VPARERNDDALRKSHAVKETAAVMVAGIDSVSDGPASPRPSIVYRLMSNEY